MLLGPRMLHFYQVRRGGGQNLEEAHRERRSDSSRSCLGCESNDADACCTFCACFLKTRLRFETKVGVPSLCHNVWRSTSRFSQDGTEDTEELEVHGTRLGI